MGNSKAIINRRNFLQTSTLGLIALLSNPRRSRIDSLNHQYGRVLDSVVYSHELPSFQSLQMFKYQKDDIVAITGINLSNDGFLFNKIWYQINHSGYTHSGSIQPVQHIINPVIMEIPNPGALAEVTVPYSDSFRGPGTNYSKAYRLYFEAVIWITNAVRGDKGETWYRFIDDEYKIPYYVLAKHIKILTPDDTSPLSPEIPIEKKYITVSLSNQTLIAYEMDQPVFMAYASTGGKFRDGSNVTPIGIFNIFYKRATRHMVGEGIGNDPYDYIGVPWVSYITENGIAIHGAYWHNNFGSKKSHGCINLNPRSAKWIYRWSNPIAPDNIKEWKDNKGTRVFINE